MRKGENKPRVKNMLAFSRVDDVMTKLTVNLSYTLVRMELQTDSSSTS